MFRFLELKTYAHSTSVPYSISVSSPLLYPLLQLFHGSIQKKLDLGCLRSFPYFAIYVGVEQVENVFTNETSAYARSVIILYVSFDHEIVHVCSSVQD